MEKCNCGCPHLAHLPPDHEMGMRDLCELEQRCGHMGALGEAFAGALDLIYRYSGAEGIEDFRRLVELKEFAGRVN